MKQVWPNYSYSPTTNVLTLTGLNIDRDQLLLVTAADRGRIMYNFADSSVTASAFTSGANTALTLVATTAGLTTTAALVIYFDDQATSSTVTGTVELGPTSLNALESITVTMGQVTVTGGLTDVQLRASAVTVSGTVTVGNSLTISSLPALSAGTAQIGSVTASISGTVPISISSVTIGNSITIGSCVTHGVTIANSSVTVNGTFFQGTQPVSLTTLPALVAGTAQIGSVTASISNFPATQAISISSVTIGNSITIGSCVTHGVTISNTSVTVNGAFYQTTQPVSISGVVQVNASQGFTVFQSEFTSTTDSTSLCSSNANRKVLSIYNQGSGALYVSAGVTCTSVSFQVKLASGDYWEAPSPQTGVFHSAVFATAGTASITQIL